MRFRPSPLAARPKPAIVKNEQILKVPLANGSYCRQTLKLAGMRPSDCRPREIRARERENGAPGLVRLGGNPFIRRHLPFVANGLRIAKLN
jgi:hypothetical protein